MLIGRMSLSGLGDCVAYGLRTVNVLQDQNLRRSLGHDKSFFRWAVRRFLLAYSITIVFGGQLSSMTII